MYIYRVNYFCLKNFYSNMEFTGILQFADRTLCPKNRFCVQCYSVLYFPTAYYSGYGVNSYTSLNRNYYLYLKVADLLFIWHNSNKSTDCAIKIYARDVICFYS